MVELTGEIITIAGDGKAGYSGDNGPATSAELDSPRSLAVDSAGDVFVADNANNVVREVVNATGEIITIAGNGKAGDSGDDGPATAAELNGPIDVALDSGGNLFISDSNNNAIREVVKATGEIIAVAGNGTAGDSGDGGPATAAELNGPGGVAFDSAGDLFIADELNNVVREVVKATGDIITVAGTGTAGYSGDDGPATAADLDLPTRLGVDSAGDVFFADTDNSVIREITPAVTVTVGQSALADHFVVTTSFGSSDVAGTAGTVTVTAEDPNGNIAGSSPNQYLGTVDLTSTDAQIAGLPPTYTFTLGDAGVHTFNVILKTAGSQTITATDSVTTSITGTSPTITVSAGHAVSLAIVKRPPGGIPAGSRFTVAVGAVDPYGNVDPTFNGNITVGLASGSNGSLGGTLTQTAVAGVATFDDLTDITSGSITLTGTSGTLTTGSSGGATVPINSATVDHFTVTTTFATPDVAGTAGTVTVAAYDAYGNLESSGPNQYEGTVDLVSSDGQTAGLPATYTFTAADAGSHTFDGVVLATAGSQTITATDSATSTLTGTSPDVQVIPAAASQVLIINGPLTLAAGTRGPVLLQFEDAYGNAGATLTTAQTIDLATTSSAGAFYASSSGGTSTTSISVPAGHSSAAFYYADTLPGNPTVTVSAPGSAPTQQETINPAPASQVVITSAPLTLTAGSRGPVEVQFEDAYGNLGATSTSDQTIGLVTTSSGGAFYAGATGGNAVTSIPITAGLSSATVYYSDTQAGSPTVTVSDTAFSSSVNQGETIVPAAADHFVVTTSFANPDVAGSVGTVTVTAKDHYGNTAGSGPNQYTGTIDLTSTDGQASGLPSSYAFTAGDAGLHTFHNVVLKTAGNPSITATDSVSGTITGTSPAVEVIPAAASQVAITSAPLTLVAGTPGQLTVQLEDPYGNTGATSTTAQTIGLSTASSAGAFYAGPSGGAAIASVAIPAGQNAATFDYGDTQTGTPMITASDTLLGSAPTQKETVNPAAADHFTVTTSFASPDVAGTMGMVTITADDTYNNRVGSGPDEYEGMVVLTSSGGQTAGLPATYTFTALDAGSHTFTNVVLKTAGSQSITATDLVTGKVNGVATVDVVPAPASRLVITSAPLTLVAGNREPVTIQLDDAYGNRAASAGVQTIGLTTTGAAGAFSASQSGTPAIAEVTIATGLSTVTVYYGDTQSGSPTLTASDSALGSAPTPTQEETVNPAAAARLVIQTQPSTKAEAGVAFAPQPVIDEEDQYGNIETGDNSTVVAVALAGGSGPLQGTESVTVKGGVATFNDLADSVAETIVLDFTCGGLPSASSNPIEVAKNGGGTNPASAPTISGESVVTAQKKNKKGKPVGKAKLQGFTLDFSTAMNAATAGFAANYRITATSTKHAKKKTIPPPTPVAFTAAYNAATNSVTLTLVGKQTFAKGGQITVSYGAVTSASGDSLASSDATFTIAPKGTSLTLG